jgi:hypothetical protein
MADFLYKCFGEACEQGIEANFQMVSQLKRLFQDAIPETAL